MNKSSTGKYTHIFFDLDHTLWDFDTNATISIKQLFAELELENLLNVNVDAFLEVYLQQNKLMWERYEKGFISSADLKWKRMWRSLLAFKKPDEALARKMSDRFLEILPVQKAVFPYTFEILTYLKDKGYHLHLITNGFEKVQNLKLQHSGMHPYFSEMITSERSQSMKPKKEIFDFALNITGAEVEKSIMIGDNLAADIQGALNAGMDCIFVNHIQEKEYTQQPTHTIHSLEELKEIL